MKIILRWKLCLITAILTSSAIANELLLRNPYNINNHLESEHFVVYWGEGLSTSDIQPLLEYLEVNWRFFIDEKLYQRPRTTHHFKENIYISGTGQPLFDDELGAIQGLDLDGHEHIIMHKDSLFDETRLKVTVAHEFFHSIQQSYNIPELSPRLWIGEATATWAAYMSLPEYAISQARNGLTQYAFYPQYSLDAVLPSQSPQYYLLEGHHYGSFVFFVFLTAYFNDDNLVGRFFEFAKNETETNSNPPAIPLLNDFLLLTYGESLRQSFHQFVTRNAVWDYPDQQAFLNAIEVQDNGQNNEHTAATENTLDNQWKTISPKYIPHRWSASYVKLLATNQTTIEVGFEGNSQGSFNNLAEWQLSVVMVKDSVYEYIDIPLTENKINRYTLQTSGANEVWLAASVSSAVKNDSEIFAYRYQFAQVGQSEASPNSPVGYATSTPLENDANQDSAGSFDVFLLFLFAQLIRARNCHKQRVILASDKFYKALS